MKQRLITCGALALGIVLFLAALYYINVDLVVGTIRRLGPALPLALLFSGLWHLARTWAWSWCFPRPGTVSFRRLARVRLAAEAFSYLTLRGIAGEPLKVVLLADRVPAREATAAVALERVSYLVGTTFIVGLGSFAALVGLPLSHLWFRVFRAFAIAAGVLAVLTALVISGRGTYFQAALRRLDRALGTSLGTGLVARFIAAVEARMLELVRGNPQRLLVLSIATVFSYICMAAEAWIILRASGDAITPNGAMAVETFSRVASFASSFIPANLGALEASSLAAAAAVGAAGGAALAIARRIRGLFWAGLGLAIYPRNVRRSDAPVHAASERSSARRGATLLYFPQDADGTTPATTRLAGLPLAERVIKSAARAGYTRIVACTAGCSDREQVLLSRLAATVPGVVLSGSRQAAAQAIDEGGERFTTAIGPATAVSPALLELAGTIMPSTGEIRDVPAGPDWPQSGVLRLTTDDARNIGAVERALSARADDRSARLPSGEEVAKGRALLALRIRTPADLDAAEQTIRRASYKDTDNKLARFNRRVSLPISVALIRTPLTANQLSVLLVAIGFYAAWLFSLGHYVAGVAGALLSLAASILDGCDGEIARLKYQESALGCWIETFGDYCYYIAIFIGLTIGAVRATHVAAFYWIGGLALAGTLVSFALLVFLRTRITAGRPERLHAIARTRFTAEPTWWSRIAWRLAFTATRSAMPYGIFAFALVNLLPGIVILAALGSNIYWVSVAVKLRSLLGQHVNSQLPSPNSQGNSVEITG
jgi:phosphatidylglycerophosphate synthase